MKYMIIPFLFLFIIPLSSQELITKELKIINGDSIVKKPNNITELISQRIKYNPDGTIKKLYQITEGYQTIDTNDIYNQENLIYEIVENYKKDKHWSIFHLKYEHTKTTNKKGHTIIKSKSFLHGKFQAYHENGNIFHNSNYTMDEEDEIWYEYDYYPNGKIKLILEMKNKQVWNVIDYRFPDGQKFENYGDFKNGEGMIAFLNHEGKPCLDCTFTDKHKTIKDWKCDE